MLGFLLALSLPDRLWAAFLAVELALSLATAGMVALLPGHSLHPRFASKRATRLARAAATLAWCGFCSTLLARLLGRLGALPVADGSSDGLVAATVVAGTLVLAHVLFVFGRR